MARFGKFGLFLGLVFGTVFGFLFAPRKGKELRSRIKAERQRGGLGFAPLQDDMKHLGQELAGIARDIYESEKVTELIELGRKNVQDLSNDFVEEVTDFHATRIEPLQKEGENTYRKAQSKFKAVKRKVVESAEIGKRAVKQIKGVIKKK